MNHSTIGGLNLSEETNALTAIENPSVDDRLCVEDGDAAEKGTILLVEDEVFVREVACEVLRSAGYRVVTARSANEADRIYDEEGLEIDLLLTDMILPGETGRELAERLRRKNPELKVLLATGYGEQMSRLTKSREPYLAKPFSSEDLLQKVGQTLAKPFLRAEMESGAPATARRLQDLAWDLT